MTDIKIAGLKKVSHWIALRDKLKTQPSDKLWVDAFEDFLETRVKTRYFDPIEAISGIQIKQGKGFSIIAIYCSLIEFFETQIKGYVFENRNYKDHTGAIVRSPTRRDRNGNSQPISTEEVFTHFLTENEPFRSHFNNVLAKDFYKKVRCAILHQAETSDNWLIKDGKESDQIIRQDTTITILHWRPLKKVFEDYLQSYKELLKSDANIQRNFIYKWNKLSRL
jgi:hypothetical protein